MSKRQYTNILTNQNCKIIADPEEKLLTWRRYLQTLYSANRPPHVEIQYCNDEGSDVQIDKVSKAIQQA